MEWPWEKANKLVQLPGHILKLDWCEDRQARLVASSLSTTPHLILTLCAPPMNIKFLLSTPRVFREISEEVFPVYRSAPTAYEGHLQL